MAINQKELAVGKEVRVRGDGTSWEIIELLGDKVKAKNTENGHEGLIPVGIIISVVNKAVSSIPSSDIQILDKPVTIKKKRSRGRPKNKE